MTTTTEFRALLAAERAAVCAMNERGIDEATEPALAAATNALLAARPTSLADCAMFLRWLRDMRELDDDGILEHVACRLEA